MNIIISAKTYEVLDCMRKQAFGNTFNSVIEHLIKNTEELERIKDEYDFTDNSDEI